MTRDAASDISDLLARGERRNGRVQARADEGPRPRVVRIRQREGRNRPDRRFRRREDRRRGGPQPGEVAGAEHRAVGGPADRSGGRERRRRAARRRAAAETQALLVRGEVLSARRRQQPADVERGDRRSVPRCGAPAFRREALRGFFHRERPRRRNLDAVRRPRQDSRSDGAGGGAPEPRPAGRRRPDDFRRRLADGARRAPVHGVRTRVVRPVPGRGKGADSRSAGLPPRRARDDRRRGGVDPDEDQRGVRHQGHAAGGTAGAAGRGASGGRRERRGASRLPVDGERPDLRLQGPDRDRQSGRVAGGHDGGGPRHEEHAPEPPAVRHAVQDGRGREHRFRDPADSPPLPRARRRGADHRHVRAVGDGDVSQAGRTPEPSTGCSRRRPTTGIPDGAGARVEREWAGVGREWARVGRKWAGVGRGWARVGRGWARVGRKWAGVAATACSGAVARGTALEIRAG